ncbi:MAG: helix-hairpin-helix domain-containing protein [Xylophilus ampelinus]
MPFTAEERLALLGCKGVGPAVLERLEAMGRGSLGRLAEANVQDILEAGARLTGFTCWKNSPQARAAIAAAIDLARARHG